MFLFGHHFTLVTDHKPLEIIYGTTRSKPSARIERWVLRLQPYHFNVIYKPGATNPADYLSRHPASPRMSHQDRMAEEYVNFIERHTAPRAMPLDEIATATRTDKTLSTLVTCLRTNKWSTDILTSFKHIKDELTVTNNGIILRGHRIVLPQALQQRAIDIAHETHLGLTKTKASIREKIWFPNIDAMVKTTLDRCLTCQALGRPGPPAPITPTTMPDGPWQTVHVDFYGPLPTGEYLLVVVDRYSRFPEVEIVHSTRASTVIPKLDKIFAVHGIPIPFSKATMVPLSMAKNTNAI